MNKFLSTFRAPRQMYSTPTAVLLLAALLICTAVSAVAQCQGPGAPSTTETTCLTAVHIPGNPLQSFDISFVNPHRAEYYLADRANAAIDIIDTEHVTFKRQLGGFVGIKLNTAGTAVDNNHSGPDGVVTHGRWLYAGDGDSSLKVFDLNAPTASALKQTLFTIDPNGKQGTTRVDEMDVTTDGELILVANNAEDPPYATLFEANGDDATSHVAPIITIAVDSLIIPAGFGLSIEQPAWDHKTKRFYVSIPTIADNPPGCNYGQLAGDVTCSGGLLVIDPLHPTKMPGAFDSVTNTGVVKLHDCGPNGATVGLHDNLLLGCTPGNLPGSKTTLVINAKTKNFANIGNITGSDEVWFNKGDNRYYTGSNAAIKPAGSPLGRGSVLGVIDETSVLIETIPQSSGSHSVAADSKRNLIFVPQQRTSAPGAKPPLGDQNLSAGPGSPTVGQLICGSTDGCIAVYSHDVDDNHDGDDKKDKGEDHR